MHNVMMWSVMIIFIFNVLWKIRLPYFVLLNLGLAIAVHWSTLIGCTEGRVQ